MPTTRPVGAALVLSALAVAAVGCPAAKPFPDLHPLTGAVTRDGRPVTAGGLIFLPEPAGGSGVIVNANVRADGTFAAETSQTSNKGRAEIRPGAPAGRYKVVYHPPSNGSRSGLEVELAERVTVGLGANSVTVALPRQLPRGSGEPRDDDPTASPAEEK
jgi:hypothetical protein